MMQGYSRASWVNQKEWTDDSMFGDNWAWLRPVRPLLTDDRRVAVTPAQMGLFGSWLIREDFEVAKDFVLRKMLDTTRGSRTPMERLLKVCAAYNVVPEGRFTFQTSVLMSSLIVARHVRENQVQPWQWLGYVVFEFSHTLGLRYLVPIDVAAHCWI